MTRHEFFKKFPDASFQDYKIYLTKVIKEYEQHGIFVEPKTLQNISTENTKLRSK